MASFPSKPPAYLESAAPIQNDEHRMSFSIIEYLALEGIPKYSQRRDWSYRSVSLHRVAKASVSFICDMGTGHSLCPVPMYCTHSVI